MPEILILYSIKPISYRQTKKKNMFQKFFKSNIIRQRQTHARGEAFKKDGTSANITFFSGIFVHKNE